MPRLEIDKFEQDKSYRTHTTYLIEGRYVGGFCIFGGTLESLPIILDELQQLAKKSGKPALLMSCDCEWGLPMRLHSGGTEFPHLMALEKMGDQKGIRQVAEAIGIEMSALGLHWNFAPVADINSDPKNPIINIRAFSGDPEAVAACAQSFYQGLESAGIIATAKHFPGHGDTHVDSHQELPIINRSFEAFEVEELVPFKQLAANEIPSIMTGHIAAPKLARSLGANSDEEKLPATISPFLTRKLLREHIAYEGVIITDSLEMYGLQKIISDPGKIASRAFVAGADILLMPTDPIAAYNGLKQGLEDNLISLEAIEKSIARIERLRNKYVNTSPPKVSVKWLEHENIAQTSAKKALQLSGEIRKPLRPSSVLIISSAAESAKKQTEMLKDLFSSAFKGITTFDFFQHRVNSWGDSPLIVLVHRPRGMLVQEKNVSSVSEMVDKIITSLRSEGVRPIGIISLGDPYIAEEFVVVKPDFILRTYSDSIPSIRAALDLLKEYI